MRHERDRATDRRTLWTLAVAGVVALTITIAGGGEAVWICVPGALLVSSAARGPVRGAINAALVVVAAMAPSLISAAVAPPRSIPLALLIPAASVAILLAGRARVERERDSLRTSALTDPLTGVANRRSLLAAIEYEIARHRRSRRSFALVMLDMDGFKLLNDRFGHPAGDDLLCEVAGALSRTVRDQDTVARIGGDEFCVLAPETDAPGLQRLVGRATAAVDGVTSGIESLAASAGAAVFPQDGTSVADLLHAADQRLLAAKRRGAWSGRRAA